MFNFCASDDSSADPVTDSYGGAILFVSFLAEMRRPWDFWKGLLCAQLFICLVYIFFGAFVRSSIWCLLTIRI